MKTWIVGALGTVAMVGVVHAADVGAPAAVLPFKALTTAAPCTVATASTPLSCSGAYVGFGLAGQGSNADIIGSGINGSVFASGITPTFTGGYQYVAGNWIAGVELDAGYATRTGATVNGVGNSFNGFRITEDFKVGGNLNGLLGQTTPITVPPQLANSVLGLYAHVGTTQWQLPGAWAMGTVSGAGVLFDISPRLFGDLRYTFTNFNGARASGLTINDDQSLMISLNYKLN